LAIARGLLAGRNAVIYGAGGAMGSAIARAFAREGALVHLVGRTRDKLDSLARELTQSGARAVSAVVDAMNREAVEKHLAEVARAGRVDISFNLIGIGGEQGQPLTAVTPASFSEPISNAMHTHFVTATAAARHMEKQGSGVILALTAQVARKPYVASGGFGVACAAIEGLCRQLAVELVAQLVDQLVDRAGGFGLDIGVLALAEERQGGAVEDLTDAPAQVEVTPVVARIRSLLARRHRSPRDFKARLVECGVEKSGIAVTDIDL
jgi:NADP-dependent 3-hydroxy acid dehydrogenase YdfG